MSKVIPTLDTKIEVLKQAIIDLEEADAALSSLRETVYGAEKDVARAQEALGDWRDEETAANIDLNRARAALAQAAACVTTAASNRK